MNGKDLYRTVGQIEDDLILAANEEPVIKPKAPVRLWALAAAACLCLVCFGGYRHFFGTSIIWQEAPGASVSKPFIPEGSAPRELTVQEAESYYQIGAFPETLGQELRRTGPDVFRIYADKVGIPVYDGTQLWYEDPDGSGTVWISLARVSAPAIQAERSSRIRGVQVALTVSEELPGEPIYSVQWERNGTFVCVTGSGIGRTGFVALVEEFLARGG